jgi:glycosyltransferase involved in cell wall biosynthesis
MEQTNSMVLVVVPAYNEETKIGRVIRGLFEHVHGLKRFDDTDCADFGSVVVIDDGSSDKTAAVACASGAVVLSHLVNRGQGAALETGDTYARMQQADYVVHFDADEQFNPADIAPALQVMKEKGIDVVLGSRFMDNRSKLPWLKKHIILPIARWVNFVFTGVRLTDAHNGFRILSKNALNKIFITQDRMAHNTEIVQQIKKYKLSYIEFPVEVRYHEYGQGVSGGYKIIRDLLVGLFFKSS